MGSTPYDTTFQTKATAKVMIGGDGYHRWTTTRKPYFVAFWMDSITVHHEKYVGEVELPAAINEIAHREFESKELLYTFEFVRDRGFVINLRKGISVDVVTEKVAIEFNPSLFDSDDDLPIAYIEWEGQGTRHGPFTSIIEQKVTLCFIDEAHMGRSFMSAPHMPKSMRHDGAIFDRRDGGYYDSNGNMLAALVMLAYIMSDDDRATFADNNESLWESMPDDGAIYSSTVDQDDHSKSADSPADNSPPTAEATDHHAGTGGDAAAEQPVSQPDVTVSQTDMSPAPPSDSPPAMDTSSMNSGTL